MTTSASTASPAAIPSSAILALSLAAFLSGISLRMTDPLLPRFAAEFSVTLGAAAYVITNFAVAYGLAQLIFGPVGDRFGKYRVIAWACAACAATAALCGLAPSLHLLLIARLLAGATAAAIIPLSMAWIGDVVRYEQRQPVLARFLIGQILGVSGGVLLGGFTADHLSWRVPFFAVALGFVLISLLLFQLNRRLPAHAKVMHVSEGHVVKRMLNQFRYVLASRWAKALLLTVFLEGAFLYGSFAFIAAHLHRSHGISLSQAGAVVMLFGLGGFLYAAKATAMVKAFGEAGLAKWGGILVALSLTGIGAAPSWYWAIPGCFCTGLGFYMLHNTLQVNATQMAPERRGAAVSAFASCFFLGQSLGVALAGLLVDSLGTTVVMFIGATGMLIVSLNFSRLRSRSLASSN